MSFNIQWHSRWAHIVYQGEIDNRIISDAHIELNDTPEFYECDVILLDFTEACLHKMQPIGLTDVIALDYGASFTNTTLKVGFITAQAANTTKIAQYVDLLTALNTPWHYAIFSDIGEAITELTNQTVVQSPD